MKNVDTTQYLLAYLRLFDNVFPHNDIERHSAQSIKLTVRLGNNSGGPFSIIEQGKFPKGLPGPIDLIKIFLRNNASKQSLIHNKQLMPIIPLPYNDIPSPIAFQSHIVNYF
jgi:hypothetical protein